MVTFFITLFLIFIQGFKIMFCDRRFKTFCLYFRQVPHKSFESLISTLKGPCGTVLLWVKMSGPSDSNSLNTKGPNVISIGPTLRTKGILILFVHTLVYLLIISLITYTSSFHYHSFLFNIVVFFRLPLDM